MDFAPVAIFTYKRFNHLNKLIESLMNCKEFENTFFYIFSDGPKDENEFLEIKDVRNLIRTKFKNNYILIESDINKGLANSVIEGVSYVLTLHEKIIVLEDDLILSSNFLDYMNRALIFYNSYDQVYQISGFNYNLKSNIEVHEAFFMPISTSWGWATWRRAWNNFKINDHRIPEILSNENQKSRFDLDGNYPYSVMLFNQLNFNINSWAILWYATVFINNGVVLYPPDSLVNNVGFDGSGTHGNKLIPLFNEVYELSSNDICLPQSVVIDPIKYELFVKAAGKFIPNKYLRVFKFLVRNFKKIFGITWI